MRWPPFLRRSGKVPRGPDGWRAYAVGDVHGCFDLLDRIVGEIVDDHERRPPAKALLVLLGDLIDRGTRSSEVLEGIRTLRLPGFRIVTLAGNHEEILLRILSGESEPIAGWLTFGGAETLASYGLDPEQIASLAPDEAQQRIAQTVPPEHHAFLDSLADSFRFGDYLFVHAGIRPGLPLARQSLSDLRWIREPFLSDPRDHKMVVVHGHTITEGIDERRNRIGIDTGAYVTGILSAIGIEGENRWFLSAEG